MFGKKEKLYLKAWWENNKVWRLAFWLAGPFWRCALQPRVSKRLRAFEKDADTEKKRHNQKQFNSTCLKETQTPREKTYSTQLILISLYTSVKSTKCE